jgi:hypothetical protein
VERRVFASDLRTCATIRESLPSAADTAISCAEEFIARNGYTDLRPAADTSRVAFESIDFAAGIAEVLRERHNSLERHAFGVCEILPLSAETKVGGFVVAFRSRDTSYARWVTMSDRYSDLRVQHVDFDTAALDSVPCRRLPVITARRR